MHKKALIVRLNKERQSSGNNIANADLQIDTVKNCQFIIVPHCDCCISAQQK